MTVEAFDLAKGINGVKGRYLGRTNSVWVRSMLVDRDDIVCCFVLQPLARAYRPDRHCESQFVTATNLETACTRILNFVVCPCVVAQQLPPQHVPASRSTAVVRVIVLVIYSSGHPGVYCIKCVCGRA